MVDVGNLSVVWCLSYLDDKLQIVSNNGIVIDPITVDCGVTKGSYPFTDTPITTQ